MAILTELQNRGVQDILIACVDGLQGFGEAINTVYPQTQFQLCIVHMVRYSFKFIPWRDRKKIAAKLKTIYDADMLDIAHANLVQFADAYGEQYPHVIKSWQDNWDRLSLLFYYSKEIYM